MARESNGRSRRRTARAIPTLASVAVSLLAGACSQLGSPAPQLTALEQPQSAAAPTTTASVTSAATDGKGELLKATEYWGKEYAKNPRDAQTALNYARNLKALGEKRQALGVLQQSSMANPNNRAVSGEFGRLALEFDQVSLAQKLLDQAEDPASPDWRIINARGTVLAKESRYREAIPLYERALTLAPDQASVLNNLALAYAMVGEIDKAEPLLRKALVAGGQDEARINQNLAMVLSLQGKYDEAKLAGARALPADKAAANVDFLRSIVQLDAKPMTTGSLPAPAKDEATSPKQKVALKSTSAADVATASSTNWATVVVAAKR